VSLHPYFSYRDPATALGWLTALGGTVVARVDGPDGTVRHAEVRIGDVVVMLGGFDDDYDPPRLRRRSVGYGVYLPVADVGAAYERALDAGSRPVIVPETTEWGRRARVLDPGGYEWTFGDYVPGWGSGSGSTDPESDAIPSR
jgi:uncharacterized glyoxalase superfamily protein PhnB